MSSAARFAIFLTVALTLWGILHCYVFWRLASVPWVAAHVPGRNLAAIGIFLWGSYVLARIAANLLPSPLAWVVEYVASAWLGAFWLIFFAVLLTDVLTVGGLLVPKAAPKIMTGAILLAGGAAILGLAQAARPPVVKDYELTIPALPPERDGLTLVHLSDLHLGSLLGETWMTRLIQQVSALKPDAVLVVGDLIDGNVDHVRPLLPILKSLQAPLGVWAVTGNHEYYAGLEPSLRLLEDAGYRVLQDRSAELVPGLVLVGVGDLTARREFGERVDPMEKVLAKRPPGATILLSHSPSEADVASSQGVRLMLSGHTHGGQIWPFNYIVALKYPLLAGRYQVSNMEVIVSRGVGTWGPRMRLWHPSEIVRIRLRAEAKRLSADSTHPPCTKAGRES